MQFIKFASLFGILFFSTINICTANSSIQSRDEASVTILESSSETTTIVDEEQQKSDDLPIVLIIPFVLLLALIAVGPLFFHHFWTKYYPVIALALGAVVVLYYIFVLHNPHKVLHTAQEYISFIALLGSLFVASGGIAIQIDKKSTPLLNTIFLFIGSVLANVIGTTGASMLLIRPFMNINKNRIKPYHIVFFIFTVSNVGGSLTPIGDPPLFLGFLKGIAFSWVIVHVWYIWIFAIFSILAVFYLFDRKNIVNDKNTYTGKIQVTGYRNIIFLLIILVAVFIDPSQMSWVPDFYAMYHIPIGLREMIQFSVMIFAYVCANRKALSLNGFDFGPIKEVAYLFAGIFASMMPALSLVEQTAKNMGKQLTVDIIYWSTGVLSGILDNAPTYLNYLTASMAKYNVSIDDKVAVNDFAHHPETAKYIIAVSIAAVFFGAMTYIGNGPNFMVKSISEKQGLKMPSFFGYMGKYSLPILLPIYFIVYLIVKFVAY